MSVQVFKYFMFRHQRDIKDTRHKKKRSSSCKCIFVDSFIILQQRVAGVFVKYVLSNIKTQSFRYEININVSRMSYKSCLVSI